MARDQKAVIAMHGHLHGKSLNSEPSIIIKRFPGEQYWTDLCSAVCYAHFETKGKLNHTFAHVARSGALLVDKI
jgi:hypothetical protein